MCFIFSLLNYNNVKLLTYVVYSYTQKFYNSRLKTPVEIWNPFSESLWVAKKNYRVSFKNIALKKMPREQTEKKGVFVPIFVINHDKSRLDRNFLKKICNYFWKSLFNRWSTLEYYRCITIWVIKFWYPFLFVL